jgi:hypothetical protein
MPNYKVVLFTDSINLQYMIEQKQAINNSLPDLAVEVVDYTDFRLALYSTNQRVPCIMIFKDESRMRSRHAKLSHTDAITFITSLVT